MSELTVKDAFALAGYPVPEGSPLSYGVDLTDFNGVKAHPAWLTCKDDGRNHIFCDEGDVGWYRQKYGSVLFMGDDRDELWPAVNLAKLPAMEAFDALPKVVADAVRAHQAQGESNE